MKKDIYNNSRTKNTIKNMQTGLVTQFVNKLLAFVVRTVFIKMLSTEYLGINGLFTNILTMLSFAELGIGNAIIFSMYKPVANDDKEKIKSLVQLYKTSYLLIGTFIFFIGICIIPFLQFLINDMPNIKESIIVIYLLFLIDTTLSYFFSYKRSVIFAYQKENIINNYTTYMYILKAVLEIVFLIFTKNFVIYLLIQIICTFTLNIIISNKSNKMFPYLKEKNITKLSISESKSIYKNVKSLVIYKFGAVVLNGTDNILMSSMFNINLVGLCSNYTLITESVKTVIKSLLNGFKSSVGNLNATSTKEKKEEIFYQLFFVCFWVYAFCCTSILILINPFIKIWLGESYILELPIVWSLILIMFIDGLRYIGIVYRETLGLFEKGKFSPFMAAILNIVLSIVFGKLLGIAGIFLATSIANLLTLVWVDPYLIHKYEFGTSSKKYFKRFLIYLFVFICNYAIVFSISNFIPDTGIVNFIIKCILVFVISNLFIYIIFRNTVEYKELKKKIFEYMKRKKINL